MFVWRKGTIVAASTGIWRKALILSVQWKEEWTLWANAQTSDSATMQLKDALQVFTLTRDGTVPLDRACPYFREARLGPELEGSDLNDPGVVTVVVALTGPKKLTAGWGLRM